MDAEDQDHFRVTLRVGNASETVGFAGRARVDGHEFRWTAEVMPLGVGLNPVPLEPATWNDEVWTLANGEVIDPDALAEVMDGLARTIQAVLNGAELAAGRAYVGAITAAFGELPAQDALID